MQALVVTDLDGTLLDSARRLPPRVVAALTAFRQGGGAVAIATGRSLYSVRAVLPVAAPIDVLIYSSGAGIVEWSSGRTLRARQMAAAEVARAAGYFDSLPLDYLVHAPPPEDHRFVYRAHHRSPDLVARMARYAGFHRELRRDEALPEAATQVLALSTATEGHAELLQAARVGLAGLTVVRTTSPLDHRSLWLEVFPAGVTKATAAAWLAARWSIPQQACLAIGNDYNDESLLAWAGRARVVQNAPSALRARFGTVPSNDSGGVADAVAEWVASM